MTFPARSIVLYNYALEHVSKNHEQTVINIEALNHILVMLGIIYYYQVTHDYIYLQYLNLVPIVILYIWALLYFEESPKFYYNKK